MLITKLLREDEFARNLFRVVLQSKRETVSLSKHISDDIIKYPRQQFSTHFTRREYSSVKYETAYRILLDYLMISRKFTYEFANVGIKRDITHKVLKHRG